VRAWRATRARGREYVRTKYKRYGARLYLPTATLLTDGQVFRSQYGFVAAHGTPCTTANRNTMTTITVCCCILFIITFRFADGSSDVPSLFLFSGERPPPIVSPTQPERSNKTVRVRRFLYTYKTVYILRSRRRATARPARGSFVTDDDRKSGQAGRPASRV